MSAGHSSIKKPNIFFKSGHFYAKIYLILYIFPFQVLPTPSTGVPPTTPDLQYQESSKENVENNETAKGSGKKQQRFEIGQRKILEGYFQQGLTNPNEESKEILADELQVQVHRVKIWFQNRRQTMKNQEKDLKAREAVHAVDYRKDTSSPGVIFVNNSKIGDILSNKPILKNIITYHETLRSNGIRIPCPRAVQLQRPTIQNAARGSNPTLPAAENRLSVQNKK